MTLLSLALLFSVTKGEDAGEFPCDLGTTACSAVLGNTKSVTDGEITLTEGRKSKHSFGKAISKRNFLFNTLSDFFLLLLFCNVSMINLIIGTENL